MERFSDRSEAGRQLGARMGAFAGAEVVVVGIPRGGVIVAAEIARTVLAPLDVIVVRKLGAPNQPELAMGAIAEDGVVVDDRTVRDAIRTSERARDAVERAETDELGRRVAAYRAGRPPISLLERTVVVVDDGIATGSTARAACLVARARGAGRVVLAAPVIARQTLAALDRVADEVVCLLAPSDLHAVGTWYDDFAPASDADVVAALATQATAPAAAHDHPQPGTYEQ